ncbi:cytochrome c1 [Pseudomonas neustonica]|uniref:Cytochrome c1 n=1 Tax=Pseudomonas neustonica TaxID=2487346 RepID=A0ABX9XJV3_9PSED|nr:MULTISPECIES: cytochrome c1 [Pseudomonas]MAB24411.1 cytochrome c1 [Pseudomonadales bacterium]MBA6418213.1 cytochrome c1 [Pseudomonas sp. 5Ae-yellow]ROZ81297.1 cytochrome c1 [Pseudomonas sp. SSM44]ROZ82849.1 cytochrome c1 [Pseudomonas neustonica]|tara:strand:- start:3576 stop:4364 length:789 start_codon:yes stop_codon:yes gene_type:complete
MKKQLIALFFALVPAVSMAAGGPAVALDEANIDLTDKAAMQDGLRTFANYCMGCHSAQYQRYERVANDLGIPEQLMLDNVVFTEGTLIGEHMKNGMRHDDGKTWFGAAPPDLTLVARVRGVDWLYTYLRTFYEDSARPLGVNNTTFPNVGMPNVMAELQGRQVVGCKAMPVKNHDGKVMRDTLTGDIMKEEQCDVLTVVPDTGTQSEEEFDTTVRNLVTFLAYSADPVKLERQRIGVYVLLYLAFLFVFAYLLKREYWRDVH